MGAELYRLTSQIAAVQHPSAPPVNSVFPILPREAIEPLQEWCFFWDWDVDRAQVRWMTAWDTPPEDVDAFAAAIAEELAAAGAVR